MTRTKKSAGTKRKTVRKARITGKSTKTQKRKATKLAKAKARVPERTTSAGSNRAEGIRLFKLAGRPTREQFILVYGERGPKMTWDQRAAAGVSAKQFPAALAAKQSGR